MFHIVLFEPEIPPNTGNIIRLCANSGAILHLIHPLGFSLDEKQLRRAGLDYQQMADVHEHDNFDAFIEKVKPNTLYACSTKGSHNHTEVNFKSGDALLFGPESRGLPDNILQSLPEQHILRVPMLASSRSLNLSNTVAIVLFEAWRQQGFAGSASQFTGHDRIR